MAADGFIHVSILPVVPEYRVHIMKAVSVVTSISNRQWAITLAGAPELQFAGDNER